MLWNLSKTKIRRVELSPTVHKFGRCFDTKNSIYGARVVFLIQPRTCASWTNSSEFHGNSEKKEGNENAANMYDIHLSLSRGGESNPSHGDLNLGLFKSPDSATVWGLPGCHSPRHAPGKGQGVVWDQSWWWWGRTVIYFMTWQQVLPIFFWVNARGKPPSSRSVFNCYPQWSGGNSTVLCPFRSLTQHQLC